MNYDAYRKFTLTSLSVAIEPYVNVLTLYMAVMLRLH